MELSEDNQTVKSSIFSLRNLIICLGIVGAVAVLIFVFKLPISTAAIFLFVLICPLIHVWMVKGGHKH